MSLEEEIRQWKDKRGAIILAHNYQRAEVQALADFTGDSLELARKAATVEAGTIVFCGVWFMAETAAILNPGKTVLIPDPDAGCPMADMINAKQLAAFKAQHPGAKVLCYVNSTAEVKALSDICVTSANAGKIVASLPRDAEVIFVPDQHLGGYTAEKEGRTFHLWPGYCPTHARLNPASIAKAREEHPGAPVMVHPECAKPVRDAADYILSTGQMCALARESGTAEFIIGTEQGILHRLRTENPGKTFHMLQQNLVCPNMKKTTPEKVLESLKELKTVVTVPPEIAIPARRSIDAMLAIK